MTQSKAFWTGIIGASLFTLTTIISAFFHPNYNHLSQFISELYAVDAPNADFIRYAFYIPSGILLFLFGIFAIQEAPKSSLATLGFIGVGVSYGLGTVICGIFNCDAGCNPQFINPTLSQIIHNLTGFITYCTVPFAILIVAIASLKWKNANSFSYSSFAVAFVSFAFMLVLNANLESPYKGVIQRVIEGSILIWIVLASVHISKVKQQNAA